MSTSGESGMERSSKTYTEYAVADDLGNILPPTYESYERADAFAQDRRRYQQECKEAAEAEKAAGFPSGNEAWWRYNKGFGGPPVKGRMWHVMKREVTGWRIAP